MGFYLEVPVNERKAQYLMNYHNASMINFPWESLSEVKQRVPDKILICVVQNPLFDAAAVIFDEDELRDFSIMDDTDRRRRSWLLMEKEEVLKLCKHPHLIKYI